MLRRSHRTRCTFLTSSRSISSHSLALYLQRLVLFRNLEFSGIYLARSFAPLELLPVGLTPESLFLCAGRSVYKLIILFITLFSKTLKGSTLTAQGQQIYRLVHREKPRSG